MYAFPIVKFLGLDHTAMKQTRQYVSPGKYYWANQKECPSYPIPSLFFPFSYENVSNVGSHTLQNYGFRLFRKLLWLQNTYHRKSCIAVLFSRHNERQFFSFHALLIYVYWLLTMYLCVISWTTISSSYYTISPSPNLEPVVILCL